MTPELRNRLVGTIIVVLSGVVFIPDILDGKKTSFKDEFKAIPARPEFKSVQKVTAFPHQEFDKKLAESQPQVSDDVAVEDNVVNSSVSSPVDVDASNPASESDNSNQEANSDTDKKIVDDTASQANTIVQPLSAKPSFNEGAKPSNTDTESVASEKEVGSYVVQLGSFRNKKNVAALVKKLQKQGFKAFTRPIKTKSGILTKVFVGPDLDKTFLEVSLPKLKTITGLSGKVTVFEPSK